MRRTSEEQKTGAYFFAQDNEFAPYYDLIEKVLNPYLGVTQNLMIDLLAASINRSQTPEESQAVLVIGSGTGSEVLPIVKRLPQVKVVAVDFSAPMNAQLKRKYDMEFPGRPFDLHIELLEADFLSNECTPERLLASLDDKFGCSSFAAAIMGFVTHHYSAEQKLEFYRRIKAVLGHGGVLIHGDLFSYPSEWLSQLSHSIGEQWINQLINPSVETKLGLTNQVARRLHDAWINHWNQTHVYAPVDDHHHSSPVASFTSNMSTLRSLGFSEVECPLRIWEIGVIYSLL